MEERLGTVLSVRSTPRLPLDESHKKAVRRVGGWCEMAASLRGREPGSRGTSTGEDTADVLCRVCELTIALQLLVVAISKCSINPITDRNPVYSHTPYT
jgi:hypothetical protein